MTTTISPAGATTDETEQLRFVDADGHIVEHPTQLQDYAPAGYRDRVLHFETDDDGIEWAVMNGARVVGNMYAASDGAGRSDDEKRYQIEGRMKYTDMRPGVNDAGARLKDMDNDGIDISVLYPTLLLNSWAIPDPVFANVMCQTYNNYISDHCSEGNGRLYAVGLLPQQDLEAAAAEIRRVATLPNMVGVFIRPNPTEAWKHFTDPVYDVIWRAADETGLPVGLHPLLSGDIPGACSGLRINRLGHDTPSGRGELPFNPFVPGTEVSLDNLLFTQSLSNPIDMQVALAFLLAGGVCERYPNVRFVVLESNGGWIVPFLERLDHHSHEFPWDRPWLKMDPSEYFRRQCYISFDPDESTLSFTATSSFVGADRIVWASDYPHPDAKFPGTTAAIRAGTSELTPEQRKRIAGENAIELYTLNV